MVVEVISAIGGLKTAVDIVRGLKDLTDKAAVASAVAGLNDALLQAQTGALELVMDKAELQETVRKLEDQLRTLQAKADDLNQYKLTDFGDGTLAYRLKEEFQTQGGPDPLLCTSCYDKGQKSTLVFENTTVGRQRSYKCPSCNTAFMLGRYEKPNLPQLKRKRI